MQSKRGANLGGANQKTRTVRGKAILQGKYAYSDPWKHASPIDTNEMVCVFSVYICRDDMSI
jgi:hypothetical protein